MLVFFTICQFDILAFGHFDILTWHFHIVAIRRYRARATIRGDRGWRLRLMSDRARGTAIIRAMRSARSEVLSHPIKG